MINLLKKQRVAIFVISVLMLFSFSDSFGKSNKSPEDKILKDKKILVVWGGWDGHQPRKFTEIVVPWLKEQGAIVTVFESLDIYTDKKVMAEVDLIIQSWTMGKISGEQEKGLLESVKNGAGIFGIHGGTGDSFRENTEFQYMIGGQWVAHPGGVIDYTVEITDKKDPVTKGVNGFSIKSEQYYVHVDPNVKVLATTTFSGKHDPWIEGAVVPVVWKKYYGKGRVFYISIGHDPAEFEMPEPWKLLTHGIEWAAASKYEPTEKWLQPVYKK